MFRSALARLAIMLLAIAVVPGSTRADTDLLCTDRPAPPAHGSTTATEAAIAPSHAPAAPSGVAVESGTWSSIQASTNPAITPRFATTPFFDPLRQRITTFGGVYAYQYVYDYYYTPHGDALNLTSADVPDWSVLSPEGAGPAPRWDHSAALDAAHDRMIVYGGRSTYGFPVGDLWILDLASGQWSQPSLSGGPPNIRYGHHAIVDPLRNRMLVYGGLVSTSSGNVATSELWSLSLTDPMTWTLLTPAGTPPPPRYFHSAIYDPDHDRMIVYGGRDLSVGLGDAWALSLADPPTWTPLAPAGGGPGVRYYHAACFDSNRRRMLMFGGKSLPTQTADVMNDTWALSLGSVPAWTYVTPVDVAPAPRYAAGAAYDPLRDELVVLWGTSGYCATGLMTDAWRLAMGSPTPVMVSLISADAEPDRVRLSWYMPGAAYASCHVDRREASGAWATIGDATGSGNGQVDYEDRSVTPGTRYAYRLSWASGTEVTYSSEVWVDVPASFSLSLDPPRPNPGPGDLTMAFSLPERGSARIDVIDVAGRRVMSRDLSTYEAGSHVLRLTDAALSSGIYLVRLRQGAHQLMARACVVR